MKEMILVLGKNSKFFIFTIPKVKMSHIILKPKNVTTVILYAVLYMANYEKVQK